MDNAQTHPEVAIPLPKAKKNMVQIGCICLMLSVAMYGLVFATLTGPILESVDAPGYVSLFSIVGAIGVSIMIPIGGKLGDLTGRRNIVVIPGMICALSGIAFAFVRSLWPLMLLRLLVSLAQGAFTSAPYIIVGQIHERKDVPKAMGMLATAVAAGGFGGSIVAAALADLGLLKLAILTPVVPLAAGVVLIGVNLPNQRREDKVPIDVPGIIALTTALCGILLALDFGSTLGWNRAPILAGFGIGIAALAVLLVVERRASEPLIPLELFRNKNYAVLLAVSFICFFYQIAMNVYAPIGALQVMGSNATAAGSLQMPRTIITIFLPAIAGTWVGKKRENTWKAMALGALLIALPMAAMGFTSPHTSIFVYFTALAVTGIAESFRSVSVTPAAQATLKPQDLGVGTALVNFVSSLSQTISAAVCGAAYNMRIAKDPKDIGNIQAGVNTVFWLAAVVSAAGFLLVLFVVRRQMSKTKYK
ncbi:MAG: MFS transporter [Coprococcus sp.]|nr:MFS transporter [Coprococcus sp.]